MDFSNLPPRSTLQVFKPDGTIVRELPASDNGAVRWDMQDAAGRPIGGGVYRVRVGRTVFAVGIVRI